MKLYSQTPKSSPGMAYWGDYGQINVGISSGLITDNNYTSEPLHYHQTGTIYFICLEGGGIVEVNSQEITLNQDQVLRVDPLEKYRVLKGVTLPFRWLTFCTSKDPQDKIIVS